MPYLLTNLQDGKVPQAHSVPEGHKPGPNEFLLGDVEYESTPADWVWDATNKKLRARTSAELLAEAKSRKKAEFEGGAVLRMESTLPVYQAVVKLARNLLATDPRFKGLADIEDKRGRGFSQVDQKTTVADVEAMTWDKIQ